MRPHIQYLEEATVQWTPLGTSAIQRRILSTDPETGATTCILSVPAGWRGSDRPYYHTHSEELYVLEGDLEISPKGTLRTGDYTYHPAYTVLGMGERSIEGATCVARYGGDYECIPLTNSLDTDEYQRQFGLSQTIHFGPDSYPWGEFGVGPNHHRHAILRRDPVTGATTTLLNLPPGWRGRAGSHYHTVSEEAYMMEGDVALEDVPVYLTSTYLFRPPRIVHGRRERSENGSKSFVWTNGPIDFNYVDVEDPLN